MTGTVFVFGSINADTSYRVAALPGAGETVIAASASSSPGGKGANQAIAAAAAGASTRLIGAVGADAAATSLLEALGSRGVDTAAITARPDAPTGNAVVYVDDAGENCIVVLSGANEQLDAKVASGGLSSIGAGDVLVLQSEVPAHANRAAAAIARTAGAAVIWNAAPAPASTSEIVGDVDLLVVNETELVQIARLLEITGATDELEIAHLAELLTATATTLETDAICTLGAAGAIYVVAGSSGRVAAPKVRAVDTTAAGDTVVGYLAAHAHLPIVERLRLATGAGALTVTRAGASSSIPPLTDVELMLVALTERTPA